MKSKKYQSIPSNPVLPKLGGMRGFQGGCKALRKEIQFFKITNDHVNMSAMSKFQFKKMGGSMRVW